MKSKLKFDVDIENQSVITAVIENSDDLRDKIANRFVNKFDRQRNLCFICVDKLANEPIEITIEPFCNDEMGFRKLFSSIPLNQQELAKDALEYLINKKKSDKDSPSK